MHRYFGECGGGRRWCGRDDVGGIGDRGCGGGVVVGSDLGCGLGFGFGCGVEQRGAVASSSSAKAPPSSSNPGAGNAPTGASILKPFIGSWTGHDRILTIASNGIATEKVFDGCCTIAYTLTFRIDHASGNHANGSLYATVTSATFNENPNWPSPGSPEAQKGQSGIVGVQDGVLVDAFAGGTFCDNAADVAGKCGL